MIIRTEDLISELEKEYSSPKCKLGRLVEEGKYFPIIRGLYETDPDTPGHYLASSVYGPSYLSFDFALGFHGLIVPRDRTITSATFGKHRTKEYNTQFGRFTYRDVPAAVFGREVGVFEENGYSYSVANPEKALCDKLYEMPPVRNVASLEDMLLNGLSMDKYRLEELDVSVVEDLAEGYRCTNVYLLKSYLHQII